MSKSIYEQAIELLLKLQGRLSTDYDKFLEVKKALEKAKKQEKIVELQNEIIEFQNDLLNKFYNIRDGNTDYEEASAIKLEIKILQNKIKELENDK